MVVINGNKASINQTEVKGGEISSIGKACATEKADMDGEKDLYGDVEPIFGSNGSQHGSQDPLADQKSKQSKSDTLGQLVSDTCTDQFALYDDDQNHFGSVQSGAKPEVGQTANPDSSLEEVFPDGKANGNKADKNGTVSQSEEEDGFGPTIVSTVGGNGNELSSEVDEKYHDSEAEEEEEMHEEESDEEEDGVPSEESFNSVVRLIV